MGGGGGGEFRQTDKDRNKIITGEFSQKDYNTNETSRRNKTDLNANLWKNINELPINRRTVTMILKRRGQTIYSCILDTNVDQINRNIFI